MLDRLLSIVAALLVAAGTIGSQSVSSAQGTIVSKSRVSETRITLNLTNAPLSEALQRIAVQASRTPTFGRAVTRSKHRVTIRLDGVSEREALEKVLNGTGITYTTSGKLLVFEQMAAATGASATGVITGRVIDARSGRPVSGASVSVGNENKVVFTGDDGSYRVITVPVGTHALTVRFVGFAKQTRNVTVGEGATVTADFKLEPSASVLGQVVITGMVVATELRAVPNAISIVTAKDIGQRGITRIDQLFRGDIPGLFAVNSGSDNPLDIVTMTSRGATALGNGSTPPIKTYVDGVELIDPRFLSQIDTKSIERIEILSGPQASTIYGSNALGGVMQVFTKRGSTAKPQAMLTLISGLIENNFRSSRAPQHDYSGSVSGLEGVLSYNVGGSWYYVSPWSPSSQQQRTSIYGGARSDWSTKIGHLGLDGSVRKTATSNKNIGTFTTHARSSAAETGEFVYVDTRTNAATMTRSGGTTALTVKYDPSSWWSHEFTMGNDGGDFETIWPEASFITPNDTALRYTLGTSNRRSVRYQTTAQIPVFSAVRATITVGGDRWRETGTTRSSPTTMVLTGTLPSPFVIRNPVEKNGGGFLQTQIGIMDQLFLTYGLRAEWNPNFGEESQPNLAPKYGIAYTRDIGLVTAKIRAAYGRSTRPPARATKDSVLNTNPAVISFYGAFPNMQYANPDLLPEFQQGGEGGLELYFGARASLVVTRYNQTTDDLIRTIPVDSVRSLLPCPTTCQASTTFRDADNYAYRRINQALNVGNIRNQGWLIESSLNTGPLTTRWSYTYARSRVIGITQKYRYLFPPGLNTGSLQPGAQVNSNPEHTWALNLAYTRAASRVGINVSGIGQMYMDVDEIGNAIITRRLTTGPLSRQRLAFPSIYRGIGKRYAMADLSASHNLSNRVELLLQVFNLTNFYQNDAGASSAVAGRQSKVGARLRF